MQLEHSKHAPSIVVRFVGDSGDGMQLTGDRLAKVSALFGNDVVTLADFPAEIRAPAGSTFGVSGYQLHIGSTEVLTSGDQVDLLIAMNPAALKVNLKSLKAGGMVIVNEDAFIQKNFERAGLQSNPLEDGSLEGYRVHRVPMTKQTTEALKDSPISTQDKARCKNFFALGLVCWLLDRPTAATSQWIDAKFVNRPEVAEANKKAMEEGFRLAETIELFNGAVPIPKLELAQAPGTYKFIGGNAALALGLVSAAQKVNRKLFFGSYPITPASDVLHELSRLWDFGVTTFQAEDEIAAIGASVGAAYAGSLAVTSTSGPGLVLKQEFVGLAVMTELPLVILDVQRAGPSTGMPTKTEQADLNLALYGRNGESPVVVLAPKSPSDCFKTAYEACRIALKYMTPVMVLSDGFLANGLEAWRIPADDELAEIEIATGQLEEQPSASEGEKTEQADSEEYLPYLRNPKTLARAWVPPGTPAKEHRIGGLEKEADTGKISYDPENHEAMCRLRASKVARVAEDYDETDFFGSSECEDLLLGWGSTFGPLRKAVGLLAMEGVQIGHLHLRYIHPFPLDLGEKLRGFKKIYVAELNLGQLVMKLRAEYPDCDFIPINQVTGQPMKVENIINAVKHHTQGVH